MNAYDMDYEIEAEKAKAGDLNAMFNMASYLVWGRDYDEISPEDAELAVSYYEANIAAGDTDSMLDLGAMYLGGRGVEKDARKAINLYKRAAKLGAPKAFRCLGNHYKYNDNLPTSSLPRLTQAYGYYVQGAELEEENSLYELGDYYLEGICVEKDENKAFELYNKAYDIIMKKVADKELSFNDNLPDVCLRLSECCHYGIGTEVDFEKAEKFINTAQNEEIRLNEFDWYVAPYWERMDKEWWSIFCREKTKVYVKSHNKKPKEESYFDMIHRLGEKSYLALTEEERKIYDNIPCDWEGLPQDFFTSKTVEEVNEYYGFGDEKKITDAIYKCLCCSYEECYELDWLCGDDEEYDEYEDYDDDEDDDDEED